MLAILSSAKQGLNQFPSAPSLSKSPLYHVSAHFQLYPLQKKKQRRSFELIPLASFLAYHSCTITTTACRSAHLLFISVVDSEGLGVRLRPASSVQRFPGGHCLLFLLKLKAKATQLSFTHTARLAIHAPHSIPLLSWFPPPPTDWSLVQFARLLHTDRPLLPSGIHCKRVSWSWMMTLCSPPPQNPIFWEMYHRLC